MELIFGNEKELIKEYKFLINEVLPSLNTCNFCTKLKCKYCKKYSVNSLCVKKIYVLIAKNLINQKTFKYRCK